MDVGLSITCRKFSRLLPPMVNYLILPEEKKRHNDGVLARDLK